MIASAGAGFSRVLRRSWRERPFLRGARRRGGNRARSRGGHLTGRPEPIHSPAEADAWIAEAQAAKVDGLVLVMLDRQQHAWPTAQKVAQCKIPSIVYSPLGASFPHNTL